jgi:hypothetical protein
MHLTIIIIAKHTSLINLERLSFATRCAAPCFMKQLQDKPVRRRLLFLGTDWALQIVAIEERDYSGDWKM